jgi:hypothetical protein
VDRTVGSSPAHPEGVDLGSSAEATSDHAVDLADVLADPVRGAELERDGFTVFPGLLDGSEVERLRGAFDAAMARWGQPIGDRWFPTILFPDPDIRRELSDAVSTVLGPHVRSVLRTSDWDLVRADYSVKPPSDASELGPHQDFSVVDERRYQSLYVWSPLDPITPTNGALHVLPGSHRFGSQVRAQYVPFVFDDAIDLVRSASVRLETRPGDLVVMVSGVAHWSPANESGRLRLAAHGLLKPVEAPIVYFYADDDTPPGTVEMYEVDMDTYIELCLVGRPGPDVPRTGLRPRPPGALLREDLVRHLAARDAEHHR